MTIIHDYLTLQKKYANQYGSKTVVIMEVGSFYELYGIRENDIIQDVAQLLNIALTKRDKRVQEVNTKNPYLVGFTAISLSKYLRVLLNHNYTVVRVDQVTNPPNPRREVTKIYSPSTSIDEFDIADTNYILCIYIETIQKKMCIGLSLIDLSTGNSILYEAYDSKNTTDKHLALQESFRFIHTYHPKEIVIYAEKCEMSKDNIISYLELDLKIYYFYTEFDSTYKKISYQDEFFGKIYNKTGLLSPIEYLDLERYEYTRISLLLLLQFAYEHDTKIIHNLNKPVIYEKQSHLILSNNAIQQLNLIRYEQYGNNGTNKYGSLYEIVNNCSTIIGKRYLKEQLLNPILSSIELIRRYNQIDELKENDLYLEYESKLKSIIDVERVHRKISLGILNPFEFYNLDSNYNNVKYILGLCKKTIHFEYNLDTIDEYISYYNSIFDVSSMYQYSFKDLSTSFFQLGQYENIDELQNQINNDYNVLDELKSHLSKLIETDFKKSKFDKDEESTFVKLEKTDKEGYFLTLTSKRFETLKTKMGKIIKIKDVVFDTDAFKIKNLNNAVKIVCPKISSLSNSVMINKDKMRSLMKVSYTESLLKIYSKYQSLMTNISNMIGNVDMIVSNAKTSIMYNYVRPQLIESDKSFVKATNLRHPITERLCNSVGYVTNDIVLGCDNIDGMIITGLNGVGKSVLIKMVATSIILAQCGMFVPASNFAYTPYNHIMSRIGNTDNILKGQSTFVKEMMELSTILKRSTQNSLVIADELCSGSEYMSAQAILASTIITLARKCCSFMFTTHLHGVTEIKEVKELDNIDFFYLDVEYNENMDDLIYHRKLKKGCSNTLYGIEVSRHILHDNDFIALANSIRSDLTNDSTQIVNTKSSKYNSDVYIDECEICQKKYSAGDLDVHHIQFQCTSDDTGFIKHQHKNVKSNLVTLCKEHHKKVHHNEIIISGWKQSTDKGLYLDYKVSEIKKRNLKYNEEVVRQVYSVKSEFLTPKQAITIIETKFNIKMGIGTIKKIWNNEYY